MKTKILIIVVLTGLFGCNESVKTQQVTETTGVVNTTVGIFISSIELKEFDYKGHTYIYSDVRDGIAMAHAGHCKCNKK